MSIISGFNKVKNYVKTTEGYKLLSRWTSSDTVDVNGKTLTEVVNELGTASKKDVAASGNASTTQVVMGNDTRLSDARKASDVYDWAKSSTKPTYTASEVGAYTKSETDTKLNSKINTSLKGSANGLAELDSNGKVPSTQLPSFVDDVIEGYLSSGKFYKESAHTTQISGESGKIYIDLSTEKTYRWSGSAFVVISETLALGETSSTAYRGDRGKTAYDHSQSTHARIDATKVEKSSTNGNIKINGTETTVYTHPSGTNPHGTTKSDVGLGNVGNFKAVSTVANQGLSDTEKSNARSNIGAQVAGSYASSTHNHDDKYQSKGSYASASHTHDDRYYTESEINTKLNGKANSSHTHTKSQITDFPTSMPASDVYAWAKASSKPSYTYSEVGAAAANHSHSGYATTTTTDSLQTQINTINSNLTNDYTNKNKALTTDTNIIFSKDLPAGTYLIVGEAQLMDTSVGRYDLYVEGNGTSIGDTFPNNYSYPCACVMLVLSFTEQKTIQLKIWQTTTSTLNNARLLTLRLK